MTSVKAMMRVAPLALVFSLVLSVLLSLAPEPAWAHAVLIGQSKIRQEGGTVRYDLAVNYDELLKRLAPRNPAPGRETVTEAERGAALRDSRGDLEAYLGRSVQVFLDGVGCDDRLDTVEVERFRGEVFAVMSSSYRCPGSPSGAVEVQYDLFFDSMSDAERSSHANVADYEVGGEQGRFVFERGEQRLVTGGGGLFSSAGQFVVLGVKHILGGIDHVLFVLALLLGARSATGILKVATAFTAAHSVTLALAATGWVSVPPSIVEPAIALSIVCVAIQNLVQKQPRHRLLVVFAFGLMHGLGFAGSLTFADQVTWRLISSLLAFNVGIEVGQAAVILLVVPLLLLVRRRRWSTSAQWAASGVIALFGLVWFVERLLLS